MLLRRSAPELVERHAPLVLLALTLLLGGGGSPYPLNELVLECAALLALVAAAWTAPPGAPFVPRGALVAICAVAALPLAQLVPLPPALWHGLPGREAQRAALALVGAQDEWRPLAISPARSLAALLSLLPPLVLLALTARARPAARRALIATVVVIGLVSVAVGAGQVAGGPDGALRFYAASHTGYLTGFQANRNAQALVLLIALAALAAWVAARREHTGSRGALAAVAALVLVVGVILTASRAGIALLVPLALALAWLGWKRFGRVRLKLPLGAVLAGAATLAAVGWWASGLGAVRAAAARFAEGAGPRPELWSDTLYAIGAHWPVGVGLGGFVPAFVAAERLEVVDPSHPNRAHNDYLELALEAGAPGLVLLALLAAALGWRLLRRLRAAGDAGERAELGFAAATLALVAVHSLVDYPLRSMALAGLTGVAAGLILAPGGRAARLRAPRHGTAESTAQ